MCEGFFVFSTILKFFLENKAIMAHNCLCRNAVTYPLLQIQNKLIFNSLLGGLRYKFQGKSSPVTRQATIMKKLMTGSSRPRKKFFRLDDNVPKALKEFDFMKSSSTISAKKPAPKFSKRVDVLNTVFIEHISSMLATGEVSTELLNYSLEISQVKVSPDFTRVNVYWACSGSEDEQKIVENLLEKAGRKLRHELSQIRLIGVVPPIEFIKDKKIAKLREVELLFEKCDFGEDFVPTLPKILNSRPTQLPVYKRHSDIIPVVPSDESQVENDAIENEILKEQDTMRQDILGINQTRIIAQVKEGMLKTQEKISKISSKAKVPISSPPEITSLGVVNEQIQLDKNRTKDFLKYLQTKRIAKSKAEKQQSEVARHRLVLESDLRERMLANQHMDYDDCEEEENDDLPETYQSFADYKRGM